MPAWSQQAGGPMRDDQLADLTEYILDWDKGTNWTIDDAMAVNQYAIEPGLGGGGGETTQAPAGNDVAAIMSRIAEQSIVGDPARGEALYTSQQPSGRGLPLGCSGCHQPGLVAPITAGTWNRIVNERLALPQFAGYTPEQYVIDSIVRPADYVVEGFAVGVMPETFGDNITLQDIADIIAYLQSTQ
jgi:mono/diheme cytochrome c family protein